MKMKVSLFLLMSGFFFVGCKHDNNKLEEGSPVSFNPVGAWEFTSTPTTFNRGTCDFSEWNTYSDTMTITQNGDALVGTMSYGFMYGVSLVYRGTFSSNTASLLINPVTGGSSPSFGKHFLVAIPGTPDDYSDSFSLTLSSDNTATGTETWSLSYSTHSCNGTQTIVATKH